MTDKSRRTKQSNRTRRWTIFLGAVVLMVAGGALGLNWMMKQPLYRFGSVSAEENLRSPLQPPEQTENARFQVESDISLAFQVHGKGATALVIHGGPGVPYAGLWKGLEALTDRFQFYLYHQRGCGNSTRPFDRFNGANFYKNMKNLEQTLGLGAQIADIERIRRILGREKIILIGHSFGGFIAALYAAEFPDRVEKLILVAPAGVLTPPDENRNLFDLARTRLPESKRQPYDQVVKEYFDFGNIFSKSDSDLVDLHERVGAFLFEAMGYSDRQFDTSPRGGGWAVFAMYFSMGRAQDYRKALGEITAPTLIVHGEDDELALAGAKSYNPIAGSRFALIKRSPGNRQAGHMVFDDSPVEFARNVSAFLAK